MDLAGSGPDEPLDVNQAASVPILARDGTLLVCLVTSMRTHQWVFPKGMIDPGETAPQAALREAQEEAGVEGELVGDPVGTYEYWKWGRRLKVAVYSMRVVRVLDRWPEAEVRNRRWFELSEASRALPYDSHRRLLEQAIERFRVSP